MDRYAIALSDCSLAFGHGGGYGTVTRWGLFLRREVFFSFLFPRSAFASLWLFPSVLEIKNWRWQDSPGQTGQTENTRSDDEIPI